MIYSKAVSALIAAKDYEGARKLMPKEKPRAPLPPRKKYLPRSTFAHDAATDTATQEALCATRGKSHTHSEVTRLASAVANAAGATPSLIAKAVGCLPVGKQNARPKPRPKKRRTAAEERARQERIYGPPGRVEFVKALGCILQAFFWTQCRGPVVNAHVGNKGAGTSRKADYDQIVPLCDCHHRELDDWLGPTDFEESYGVNLAECAAETERAWLVASGGDE